MCQFNRLSNYFSVLQHKLLTSYLLSALTFDILNLFTSLRRKQTPLVLHVHRALSSEPRHVLTNKSKGHFKAKDVIKRSCILIS